MRYTNIKKAIQDEQQNQTTTTKKNYIKNFMSVLKTKYKNKVKIASDKFETKKTAIHHKRHGPVHNKAW